MRRKSFEDMTCSVAQCLEVVGEWWTMLIVRDLFLGVRRFDALQTRLGISRNILTERLDHLIAHGVVERRPYQERPTRYDYVLTEKGRGLWPVLNAMRQWGDEWSAPNGPPVELVHRAVRPPHARGHHLCDVRRADGDERRAGGGRAGRVARQPRTPRLIRPGWCVVRWPTRRRGPPRSTPPTGRSARPRR